MGGLEPQWPLVPLNSTEQTNYPDKQSDQDDTEDLLGTAPLSQ